VGPGDSGKSSVLDAIELCLLGRRSFPFSDTDFHKLDVTKPISISLTLGSLPDKLKNLDSYGDFLRGFDPITGFVEDEPRANLETVLTVSLKVESDLEPTWSLYSERTERQGVERNLSWKDRALVTPARIGTFASSSLSWTRSSVLNRLTDDRAELGEALALAAREARTSFGDKAGGQFANTLKVVNQTAVKLGIPVGASAQALLDAHSVSIGDGAIALHDAAGVPLRALGTGSSRLLVAGLQRAATQASTIALVDEVEHGLEPHRVIRLLDSLGAKEEVPPMQAFLTTHSPVAVRELGGHQIVVVRHNGVQHMMLNAGSSDDIQSTLRADPEAFLAKSVIVCEGASEVGLARGLDQYWVMNGHPSFFAQGGAFVDVGGSNPDRCFQRGTALLKLGYRVLVIVDADKAPKPEEVKAFTEAGGDYLSWQNGRALEDELFLSLNDEAVDKLLQVASETVGRDLMSQHVRSKANNQTTLEQIECESANSLDGYAREDLELLGRASRIRGSGWFKSFTTYQEIGRDIVGPGFPGAKPEFQAIITKLWIWMHGH
jgi:hypothetical protein